MSDQLVVMTREREHSAWFSFQTELRLSLMVLSLFARTISFFRSVLHLSIAFDITLLLGWRYVFF